jgi:aminoglycoside phosphotransferase (APT) family kinase protein
MSDLQADSTVAIRTGEEFNLTNLNNYLIQHAPHITKVLSITQFPGGFSNLTYCLKTDKEEFVLRRPPFGANIKSAHDMGREFRVLSALKDHYTKIPQPVVYCESKDVIGAPFYIMTRINGVILRAANAPKMNLPTEVYHKTSEALIDNLVALHSLDIHQTGLVELGKPEGYVLRQVEGWIKRYYNAETDKIESLDALAEWLKANMPSEQAPAFIHNDYKYDNVILDPNDLSNILGVLDWEMATVGDPLMDLGATLAYWSEARDTDEVKFFNLTWLPGNLSREEVVQRYAEKSGRDVSNILFYYLFGLYKNAVIAQQIYARWKQGHTKDARFGGLLPIIKGLGAKAELALQSGKI